MAQGIKSRLLTLARSSNSSGEPVTFPHQTARRIPPDRILEVVQVTPDELRMLRSRLKEGADIHAAMGRLLARKTTMALNRIIEAKTRKKEAIKPETKK